MIMNPQATLPFRSVDGQIVLTNDFSWHAITMSVAEIGHVAFQSDADMRLCIFCMHEIKRLMAHSQYLRRTDGFGFGHTLLAIFIPPSKTSLQHISKSIHQDSGRSWSTNCCQ